jgi:hypothetical protein
MRFRSLQLRLCNTDRSLLCLIFYILKYFSKEIDLNHICPTTKEDKMLSGVAFMFFEIKKMKK